MRKGEAQDTFTLHGNYGNASCSDAPQKNQNGQELLIILYLVE